MSAPFPARIAKVFRKTITFTGAASAGAVGTVAVATTTGSVLITAGGVLCTTLLTSAGGGTLTLGTASNADGLIGLTTATAIDASEWWQDSTPEAQISPAIVNQLVTGNIILTVGTADITAGVLEFCFYYLPFSSTGNLA